MIKAAYHTTKFWIIIVLLSIVLGTLAVLARLFDSSNNLSHRVSSLWGRWLCAFNGIQVDIEGLEHVRRDQSQIFVANHQGYFDIFALSGFLPVQIRWVAKSSLFKIPFVGWAIAASGYIPVDRSNRKKSYQAFLATIEKLKAGNSIVIFPEGTRSEDGTIGPFKKGGLLLSVRSGAPLVPVTLLGTGNIIKKGSGIIKPGRIQIIISPPISSQAVKDEREENVLRTLRNIICKNYEHHQTLQRENKNTPQAG
jgi:1-acyl-sn-glycerol-3-phosphate acyltransferase